MRNLNEPLRRDNEPLKKDIEGQVIPIDSRQRAVENTQTLVPKDQIGDLRNCWTSVQSSFVDDPQRAVQDADELVSKVIDQLTEGFRNRRADLDRQWKGGSQPSTEDLRVALQRYRLFFDRLLSL